jgi:hypothetical protein
VDLFRSGTYYFSVRPGTLRRVVAPVAALLLTVCLPVASHRAAAESLVVSGTSVVTYVQPVTLRPSVQLMDQGKIISTWGMDGQGHARVSIHTAAPALMSSTEAVTISGSTITRYSDLYNRAIREKVSSPITTDGMWGWLGFYAGGSLVSLVQRMGLGYVAWANGQGMHAAVVRQSEVDGRPVDVIEVSPAAQSQSGSATTSGIGKATIWLDKQYPVVLKASVADTPDQPQHWLYRVTSVNPGRLPDSTFLQYRPPVRAVEAPQSPGSGSPGNSLPSPVLSGPRGFLTVKAPAGYMLRSWESAADPLWGKTSSIGGVFTGNGFLAIREQVRATGLPQELRAGGSRRAGRCQVWTGIWSGARWLALEHKNVSLLAVSDKLTQKDLIHLAATGICE